MLLSLNTPNSAERIQNQNLVKHLNFKHTKFLHYLFFEIPVYVIMFTGKEYI